MTLCYTAYSYITRVCHRRHTLVLFSPRAVTLPTRSLPALAKKLFGNHKRAFHYFQVALDKSQAALYDSQVPLYDCQVPLYTAQVALLPLPDSTLRRQKWHSAMAACHSPHFSLALFLQKPVYCAPPIHDTACAENDETLHIDPFPTLPHARRRGGKGACHSSLPHTSST